ncbi:MAG: hypothetical protein ACLSB9_35805 [Hydrogeniiclostridium mannosilyticum]
MLAVQRFRRYAQPLEVIENVGLNALQTGLGRLDAVRVNAKGEILGFDKAVVALASWFCSMVVYSTRILSKSSLEGDVDGAGKGFSDAARFKKTAQTESSCRSSEKSHQPSKIAVYPRSVKADS